MQRRVHDRFAEAEVTFADGDTRLAGLVVTPAGGGPYPAAVLVHGSGPADRDSRGYFVAVREHLVAHGFAVLCYDKPGVGGSTGDWRQQSFPDRAREVLAALRFLRSYPGIAPGRVGLCGGSQAGWVMPLVAQLADNLAFIVSISGSAIPPHEQEAYRIRRQLEVDGFPAAQVTHAIAAVERRLQMLRAGASPGQIFAAEAGMRGEPWYDYLGDESEADLAFFAAIYDFDPLPVLERVRCPFLGIWGDLDSNVPVEKSVALTRAALTRAGNPRFTLRVFPRANHGIRSARTGSPHEAVTAFAPGYLESITDWLAALG